MYKPDKKPEKTLEICPCGCGKQLTDVEVFKGGCLNWQRETMKKKVEQQRKQIDNFVDRIK